MHRLATAAAGFLAAFLWTGGVFAAGTDIDGSADYPDIGRFEGSWITRYDVKDFDEY